MESGSLLQFSQQPDSFLYIVLVDSSLMKDARQQKTIFISLFQMRAHRSNIASIQ